MLPATAVMGSDVSTGHVHAPSEQQVVMHHRRVQPAPPVRGARRFWPRRKPVQVQRAVSTGQEGMLLPYLVEARTESSLRQQPSCSGKEITCSSPRQASIVQLEHLERLRLGTLARRRVQHRAFRPLGGALRGLRRAVGRALRLLSANISPKGPGGNDNEPLERSLNVVTCAPFFYVGLQVLRTCSAAATRHFGYSFLVAGTAATLYHSTAGRLRCWLRKADHWAIGYASCALRNCVLGPSFPAALRAASLLAIPFRPSLLATTNFMFVEARFFGLARQAPAMMAKWLAHGAVGAAAGVFFYLDGSPLLAWCPYAHALWHCCASAAILTCHTCAPGMLMPA